MTVTYFDNFKTVNDPKFFSVDMVLERIRNGASKQLIEQLRLIKDPEQQKDFKLNKLPLICFSGQFTRRAAVAFKNPSGLAIMDWDDVQPESLRDLQTIIISEPYTYACWVSPRGGLKALIRIADADKYKEQYEALLDYFNALTIDYCQADKANKDIARGCFESYDPDIYINRDAKPFQYYIKHERMEMPTYESKVELIPRILKWTASKNQYFQDGQRNHFILCFAGACCRFGIDQYDCLAFCDNQFLANDTSFSRKECEQTIANAYRFWQNQFGTAEFNSGKVVDTKTLMEIDVAPPAELFDSTQPAKDVVYGASVIDRALDLLEKGLPFIEGVGIPMLDNLFKFRRGEISLLSGHGNHGKSSIMKYMMLCHAAKYGRKFAIFPPEDNPAELFYHDLVEILLGLECNPGNRFAPSKANYERAFRWVSDHFFYIYPETESPTPAYIKQRFLELIIKEKVDGCVIDPFNQMDNDISKAGGRDDQYLSIVLGDFARFAAQNNVYFFILSHPKGAGKKTNGDNYPCPDVYDLAGGAMWNNKMWNILVYHRPFFYSLPQDSTCELHAKKIKRKEVGKRGFISFEYRYTKRRFLFDGDDPMDRILGELNLHAYLPTPQVIAPDFQDTLPFDDVPF